MISAFRRLLARPILMATGLSAQPSWRIGLFRLAWRISGDDGMGMYYLGCLLQFGTREIAIQEGRAILRRRPLPRVAGFIGLMCLDQTPRDVQTARQMAAIVREHGRTGLEGRVLEFNLRFLEVSRPQVPALCDEFLQWRDQMPAYNQILIMEKASACLLLGDFDRAATEARRILAVEDHGRAEMILWAERLHAGDEAAARQHLALAKLDAKTKLNAQLVGWKSLGDEQALAEGLEQLRQMDEAYAAGMRRYLELPEEAA